MIIPPRQKSTQEQVPAKDITSESSSSWTIDLPPGRLGGTLTFEFADGIAASIRHDRLDGTAITYDFPFSRRTPSTEEAIRRFANRYGAGVMISELERNHYVRFRTEFIFDRFSRLERNGSHRILDFGCGAGHSLDALLGYFPHARFTGADIAEDRLDIFNSYLPASDRERIELILMRDPRELDSLGNDFDVINLNAVFEHLLPHERRWLLPGLWSKLAVGGMLVVTETPWRWFPIETHTTSKPLVNYLPDRLALAVTRRSREYDSSLTWEAALRDGVRGGTVAEIISCIGAPAGTAQLLQSGAPDARDLLEVWWHGEPRHTRQKELAYRSLAWLRRMTGVVVSPWVNIVLRKTASP
jgi:2-polyprenyl-3-methyl-5-hydroxy-6-metoxy-1,4-benzoquinol methylase